MKRAGSGHELGELRAGWCSIQQSYSIPGYFAFSLQPQDEEQHQSGNLGHPERDGLDQLRKGTRQTGSGCWWHGLVLRRSRGDSCRLLHNLPEQFKQQGEDTRTSPGCQTARAGDWSTPRGLRPTFTLACAPLQHSEECRFILPTQLGFRFPFAFFCLPVTVTDKVSEAPVTKKSSQAGIDVLRWPWMQSKSLPTSGWKREG